jgi:hypothetical protein
MEFSKNKWKYSTFALLAVLAIGYSFPDALAVSDSQLKKRFDAIWAAINGLVAKTDDMQAQIDNIELTSGNDGLNCWDINGDGVKDSVEDINDDGKWDALDCQGSSSGFAPNTAPVIDAGTDQSVLSPSRFLPTTL